MKMDRLETMRHKEKQAHMFFQKWKTLIGACLTRPEIRDSVSPFTQYTQWYGREQRQGSLGFL